MGDNEPSAIEVIRPATGRQFRFALFDFDGTLSLIREGWPDVMIAMMVEYLQPVAANLPEDRLREMLVADIAVSTGQPTIYQMMRLAERVAEFGGRPLAPRQYKAEYDRRLLAHIADRREALAAGRATPDSRLLGGARPMVEALVSRGLTLCLASGTDEPFVREEAALLDLARYFGRHIYGALEDYEVSSKRRVIERLLAENHIRGDELLVFGDGYVEIEDGKAVGGYAVGVASDEKAGGGRLNAWKRDRLILAGADVIVPDFAAHERLLTLLFGEG